MDQYIGRDDPDEARRLAGQEPGGLDELRAALALCALPERPRVLELGCGSGVFTAMLLEALPGASILATDLNETLLAAARERLAGYLGGEHASGAARLRFARADAARLPYPAREFDLVACRCLLMHQADPSAVAAEMHRVADLGGYALAIEPDWGARAVYPDAEALAALLDLARRGQPHGFPDLLLGRKLFALLRAAGFAPVRLRATALVTTFDEQPTPGDGPVEAPSGPDGLLLQGRRLLRAAGLISDAELDALAARLAASARSPDYCSAGLDLVAVGQKPAPRLVAE
ncbi:MAG TPA: methyltransferase domain-containing protein [Ktedonobacterales bacterium]|jgi:SAM-dependent methyltransferase